MSAAPAWYIVTGRHDGDDEDSIEIVQATDREDATAAFTAALNAQASGAAREVYISHVVRCPGDRPIVQ